MLFDTALATQTKILTDAQNAANLALLNAVGVAHAAAQQGLRHAELAAADQWEEQASVSAISDDDLAKITQSVTAAVTAVLANVATGRPPVNQSGTTGTSVATPAGH
jgi:Flp pilus assembly protein TadG